LALLASFCSILYHNTEPLSDESIVYVVIMATCAPPTHPPSWLQVLVMAVEAVLEVRVHLKPPSLHQLARTARDRRPPFSGSEYIVSHLKGLELERILILTRTSTHTYVSCRPDFKRKSARGFKEDPYVFFKKDSDFFDNIK